MLTRQKTLLLLLEQAGRPVQRMELTKWCFLLRHEFPARGGNAFYDFVPYRFGPFSFALYQEIGKLRQKGFLALSDNDSWSSCAAGAGQTVLPPMPVRADVERLIDLFEPMPLDDLVDYVYQKYPAYTVNSERQQLAERPTTQCAVFTSGYEGLSIDGFLNRMVEKGIERVIDVRRNPVARRYGFHRSTLSRLLRHLDIEYVHVPELGIASTFRQSLDTYEDYQKLFAQYEATTLVSEKEAIVRVARLIRERPSVLICMEADPAYCHRTRVANRVADLVELPIIHLGAEG